MTTAQDPQSLLIVGQRRSGTTSLYHILNQHPDIWMYPKVDLNFFLEKEYGSRKRFIGKLNQEKWFLENTITSYQELFKEGSHHIYTGHKGADLLYMQETHQRIRRFVPDIKLFVILRNPVSRAWSHYWNEVGKGREKLSFTEAIQQEEVRIAKSDYDRCHLSYVDRGLYARSLENLFEVFDQKNVLVIILEKLFQDPEQEISRIFSFLRLRQYSEKYALPATQNENWTMVRKEFAQKGGGALLFKLHEQISEKLVSILIRDKKKRKQYTNILLTPFASSVKSLKMKSEDKRYLINHYKKANENLAKMIDIDLSIWT